MALPKLSIIVPNYNSGLYIEETLLSIIGQEYPHMELIVIDGGSTDNSVEIIKKYEQHITYWVSEKDKGQSDAINKGFAQATGDYIAWMNSDDTYHKNAFKKIFLVPGIEQYDFIYGPVCIGSDSGNAVFTKNNLVKNLSLYGLLQFFYSVDYIIPSQSVFVKNTFLQKNKIGYLNEACHYCMDMEWYCRIALANPKYYTYRDALSFFRVNETTKTGSQYSKMQAEAIQVFLNYRKYLSQQQQSSIFRLLFYHRVLHKFFRGKIMPNICSLSRLFFKTPFTALFDRRFLGLLRRV